MVCSNRCHFCHRCHIWHRIQAMPISDVSQTCSFTCFRCLVFRIQMVMLFSAQGRLYTDILGQILLQYPWFVMNCLTTVFPWMFIHKLTCLLRFSQCIQLFISSIFFLNRRHLGHVIRLSNQSGHQSNSLSAHKITRLSILAFTAIYGYIPKGFILILHWYLRFSNLKRPYNRWWNKL